MKKLICTTLATLLLIASLTACDDIDNTSDNDKIAVLQNKEDPENYDCNTVDNSCMTIVDFSTYDSILSTYRKIVELCPKYDSFDEKEYFMFSNEMSYNLYEKILFSTLSLYPRNTYGIDGNCYNQFGYTIKDLNGDSVEELILRLDNHQIIAIFSMLDNLPILLDHFWNRHSCWIDSNGYIHIGGSNGADRGITQIYRVEEKNEELILVEEFGTDGHDEKTGETYFYKLVNDKKVYISENEYIDFVQNLPYENFEITKNISIYLNFVSIFDEKHPSPPPYILPSKG